MLLALGILVQLFSDQNTAATTAHLLTGPSGYRVDIEFDESNADNFLLKREAIGPTGSSFKRPADESQQGLLPPGIGLL